MMVETAAMFRRGSLWEAKGREGLGIGKATRQTVFPLHVRSKI